MLSEFTCHLVEDTLNGSNIYWALIQGGTLIFFAVLMLSGILKSKNNFIRNAALFIVMFLTIFICRLPNTIRPECNPDEGQWLVQANNFAHDPLLWIRYFMPREYSRVFTILPLGFAALVTGTIENYSYIHIFSLSIWACFAFVFFKCACHLFDKKTATYSVLFVVSSIALMSGYDFIAYNSELPAILLLIIGHYLFVSFSISQKNTYLFLLGIVLPAVPFAKEQAVFIAIIYEILALAFLLYRKQTKPALTLLAGNVITIAILLIPYIVFDTMDQLLLMLNLSAHYSRYGAEIVQKTLYQRIDTFIFVFLNREMRLIAALSLTVLLFNIGGTFFPRKTSNKTFRLHFYFLLALFLATALSVFTPGNPYEHYSILFYFSCSLIICYGIFQIINSIPARHAIWVPVCLCALFFFGRKIYRDEGIVKIEKSCNPSFTNSLTEEIRSLTDTNDRMLIWGWNNSYFAETQLLPASRFTYPVFAVKDYPGKNAVLKMYLEDLMFFRPKIILELVGEQQFYFTNYAAEGLHNFPKIYQYINDNYTLKTSKNGERLYVLKNHSR